MIYQDILSEEIKKEIDTDLGILRATYATCRRLIEQRDKNECLKFLQYVSKYWGESKMKDIKGDMIDAGIL